MINQKQQESNEKGQLRTMVSEKIKQKKIEILHDLERLQKHLKEEHKELFESLDLPSHHGINTCGINQNQNSLDIKTGELKALIALYRQI